MNDVSTWSLEKIAIVTAAWIGVICFAGAVAFGFLSLSEYLYRRKGGG